MSAFVHAAICVEVEDAVLVAACCSFTGPMPLISVSLSAACRRGGAAAAAFDGAGLRRDGRIWSALEAPRRHLDALAGFVAVADRVGDRPGHHRRRIRRAVRAVRLAVELLDHLLVADFGQHVGDLLVVDAEIGGDDARVVLHRWSDRRRRSCGRIRARRRGRKSASPPTCRARSAGSTCRSSSLMSIEQRR